MILAAGLSPAWQQILEFEQLRPGEVNRAARATWCASGKALNVARALAALGANAAVLSPAGGDTGLSLRKEFEGTRVAGHWTSVAVPTRVCTTLLDRSSGVTTELVENVGPMSSEELSCYAARFRDLLPSATAVVVTGSQPAGTPPEYFATLLRGWPGMLLLDTRGADLRASLTLQPQVVKPNRQELEQTVGRALPDERDIVIAARDLMRDGAKSVVVSCGERPLIAVNETGAWSISTPRVQTVNPIGCGDCLAAGIVDALVRGESFVESIRRGVAAAADNATELLPARIDRTRVERLLDRVTANRLD